MKDIKKPQGHIMHKKMNNKGVALLMALFFVMIMSFLALSVSEETIVEYNVSAQAVNRLRAYYAAKSGVEISLLRILIYKQAISRYGSQLKGNTSMLDPIWSFPLAWPPSGFIPKGTLTLANQIQLKDIEEESMMDSQYMTTISIEDSKLDINDLGSVSEGLRKSVREQLMQMFKREMENEEEFEKTFGDIDELDFEKLVNNIEDWIDQDSESLNGGDENSKYPDADVDTEFMPPNHAFKTIDELHMVADMTDELFNLIKSRITVYGVKGINVNYAKQKMLLTLDPQMTPELVSSIISKIKDPERGPFKDENELMGFIQGDPDGFDTTEFNPSEIPLVFDAIYNFRIESTGVYGNSKKEIMAITYDLEGIRERYIKILEDEENKNNEDDNQNQTNNQDQNNNQNQNNNKKSSAKNNAPKGRPTIVYWTEN